jgi:ADP-ribosylation factor GTPase-activating protein 2/3
MFVSLIFRAMQVGGNANAVSLSLFSFYSMINELFCHQDAFFEQHNCTTKDIQQKYNSRAAQLYREKLHSLATKAMKQYGTKVSLFFYHRRFLKRFI